ncbi:MAG: hypothetical protein WDO17_15425 [Alphaproteobacteria bacterium]
MRMNDSEKARIENVVRTAAMMAAKGVPLDEAFLGKLATEASDPRLSDAQRMAMATAETEQHVGIGRPVNLLSATPRELAAQAAAGNIQIGRFVNGQLVAGVADSDQGGRSGSSGNRFGEISKAAIEARDIALSHGMAWAADNRELLKMGPAAMQALADVHLRQDSYQRFKDAGLSNKTIVSGARWAKRNDVDYNEFSQSFSQNQNALGPTDRRVHKLAVDGLLNSSSTSQEAAAGSYNRVMDQLKTKRPEMKDSLQREQDLVNKQHKKEHTVVKKADASNVKANNKEAEQTKAKSKALAALDM